MASIIRELEKKQKRREQEKIQLVDYVVDGWMKPKKPMEYNHEKLGFDRVVELGNTIVEKKSDGFCVHVGVDHGNLKMYSSSGNLWNPECFPELTEGLLGLPNGYYHGELVGKKTKDGFKSLDEFEAVQQRPKLNSAKVTGELLERYPLQLDLFDVLVSEEKQLLDVALFDRRYILEHSLNGQKNIGLILGMEACDGEELSDLYQDAVESKFEGLIAKDPASLYVPGSRDNDWIKLKEFTTLDLAVLGFYETPESRKAGKPFSALLAGSYNDETGKYETVVKVKVGAKKDQEEIYSRVRTTFTYGKYENAVAANDEIVFNPAMKGKKIPNEVVTSKMPIVEIKTLDVTYNDNWHSCGYNGKAHSLRTPTFERLRTDKTEVKDITTTKQMQEYYFG